MLGNLPSKGLLGGGVPNDKKKSKLPKRTPSAPLYYATHDTAPPAHQLISTDETNRLLRKFHTIIKEREEKGKQGKRNGFEQPQGGSADKRAKK